MKTLSTFLSFLTVALLAAFFSCKKNDPTPNSVDGLLTYRGWQILSFSSEGVPLGLEKYNEDDYFVFYANGTYAFVTGEDEMPLRKNSLSGAVPEKQSNSFSSTWALSGDHTILTLMEPHRSGRRTDGSLKEVVHYKIGIAKDKLVLTEIEG